MKEQILEILEKQIEKKEKELYRIILMENNYPTRLDYLTDLENCDLERIRLEKCLSWLRER